jgi:hypothetical protein
MRIAQAVATQFDTTVVAAFEALLAGCGESYRLAAEDEFGVIARAADASEAVAVEAA